MSDIKTEYRGYTIRYGGNSDEWQCLEVNYSSASLSKVKARIDKMYLDLRKKSIVPVFEISRGGTHGAPLLTPSSVIEFVKTKVERSSYRQEAAQTEKHVVAVVAQRRGSDRPSRREAEINDLMPCTLEAEKAWENYVSAHKAYFAAYQVAEQAFKDIPRVSLDDVAALKAIKEGERDNDNE